MTTLSSLISPTGVSAQTGLTGVQQHQSEVGPGSCVVGSQSNGLSIERLTCPVALKGIID